MVKGQVEHFDNVHESWAVHKYYMNSLGTLIDLDTFNSNILTLKGPGHLAHRVKKNYFSGTKSRIDLKPGCKFKFVVCLEFYLKRLVRLDH